MASYISRLAEAHCVTVSSIFRTITDERNRVHSLADANINSSSRNAEILESILGELTTNNNLKNLTMLKFKEVISNHKLMKRIKAWCPICLEEMKAKGVPIYEKLIWNVNYVNCCSIHYILLEDKCKYCNAHQNILGECIRNGYCLKCGEWLGSMNKIQKIKGLADEHYLLKVEHYLGEIIASPNLTLSPSSLGKSLKSVKSFFPSPQKKFCKHTLNMNFNSYSSYILMQTKPEILNLIKICSYFNISLKDILVNNINTSDMPLVSENLSLPKIKKPRFNRIEVSNKIEELLNQNNRFPISLNEVAEELGYSLPTINNHLPHLIKMIIEKNKVNRKLLSKEVKKQREIRIRSCIIELYTEGIYPSIRTLQKKLDFPFTTYSEEHLKVWRKTLKELNIQIKKPR